MSKFTDHYAAAKAAHPCELLVIRVGDFYEAMFADAKPVADCLDITLTSRDGVPMSGFPVHSSARCIEELEAAGHVVVIA